MDTGDPRPLSPPARTERDKRGWDWSKITSLVTAFTALAALVFTGESLTATREQNALAQQGQVTGRYTSAVDQIGTHGDDHLQTRLGGVYALERLMTDSPRDQPTIIEVLSAFVRGSVPRADAHFRSAKAEDTGCPRSDDGPQADVQAALTVLGRRNPQRDANTRINLALTCLQGVHLANAAFADADLDFADLRGADLQDADFHGANFVGAHLTVANLSRANLSQAKLSEAALNGAYLTRANLRSASAIAANLTVAQLDDADLRGAQLDGATLLNANLRNANLTGAGLDSANLDRAILTGAQGLPHG